MLEGRTKQSREWREQRDEWWSNRLGMDITPRWVLQFWGTEVARRAFHDDIWIASLENKLRTSSDDIVISDCRFPNEIKAIKRAGGRVIRVIRGPEPAWYTLAETVNQGPKNNIEWRMSKNKLETHNVHASETAWIGTDFDAVIDNNEDGFNSLYKQVNDLLLNLQYAKEDLPD
jgi:hypothetical protein